MNIKIKSLLLVALGLLMVGCVNVGPNYEPIPLEPVYLGESLLHEEENTRDISDINQDWWKQFNDQDLEKLILVADSQNPTIAIAKANLARATAIFNDAKDDDLPIGFLSSEYSYDRNSLSPDTSLSSQRTTNQVRSFGLTSNWEIDLFGKLSSAEEAAFSDAEAAHYQWQQARLALVSNIANTYIQYRGLQTRVSVANETLSSLLKTQKIVNNQVEMGFVTRLDALRVEEQISSVRSVLPRLNAEVEATRQALIALAGGEDLLDGFNWNRKDIPSLVQPIPIKNSEYFLMHRPDVLAAERRIASALSNIGVAEAALYPELSLTGFLGFLSTQGGIRSDNRAWSVAPTLSWQILDLGSVRAQIKASNADMEAAYAEFERTVLIAISETQTSLSNYSQLQLSLYALEEQVGINKEALDLARFQYQNGAISLLDLLDIERQWLSSRDLRVNAQAEMTQALIDIYTSLGGGILTEA